MQAKAGKGFKKNKKTFLMSAGRLGAPMGRRPFGKKITKSNANVGAYGMKRKTSRKRIGKAKVVRNGRPLTTGKLGGALNSFRMSKAAPMPLRGTKDKKTSSFFMSPRMKLKRASAMPQSTPMSFRPPG